MNVYRGVEIYLLPLDPKFDPRWRRMDTFTPRQIYPREEAPVPIEYEAGWAAKPVSAFWKRYKSLVLTGIPSPGRPARILVSIPTALFRLA
jgi:hypothetical protein